MKVILDLNSSSIQLIEMIKNKLGIIGNNDGEIIHLALDMYADYVFKQNEITKKEIENILKSVEKISDKNDK